VEVVEVTRTFPGFELGSWRLIAIPPVFEPSLKDLLQQLIRFVAIVRYGYDSLLLFVDIFFPPFKMILFLRNVRIVLMKTSIRYWLHGI